MEGHQRPAWACELRLSVLGRFEEDASDRDFAGGKAVPKPWTLKDVENWRFEFVGETKNDM